MTLLKLCEPLFQYVCKLRRSAAKGCDLPLGMVQSDIRKLFDTMQANASGDSALAGQFERMRLPLVFFVDFMVKESGLGFRSEWVPLAHEFNELAGNQKFFVLLGSDLPDPSDGATERLVVYHSCLGLGFMGMYAGQPARIQELMARISTRISGSMDAGEGSQMCPQAYQCTDSTDLSTPPGTKLATIGIILIGSIVVWFFCYFLAFHLASKDISRTITEINRQTTPSSGSSHSQ